MSRGVALTFLFASFLFIYEHTTFDLGDGDTGKLKRARTNKDSGKKKNSDKARVKFLQEQVAALKKSQEETKSILESQMKILSQFASQPLPVINEDDNSGYDNLQERTRFYTKFRRKSYFEKARRRDEWRSRFDHLHGREKTRAMFIQLYKEFSKKDPTPEMLIEVFEPKTALERIRQKDEKLKLEMERGMTSNRLTEEDIERIEIEKMCQEANEMIVTSDEDPPMPPHMLKLKELTEQLSEQGLIDDAKKRIAMNTVQYLNMKYPHEQHCLLSDI